MFAQGTDRRSGSGCKFPTCTSPLCFAPCLGLILCAASLVARAEPTEKPPPTQESAGARHASAEWTQDSNGNGVIIQSRLRDGSSIKEFKGTGVIAATPSAIFAILDDAESYPSFMPYTAECRVLKRAKDWMLAYQRLEVPLVSDRDYTVRSQIAKWLGPDGLIYRIRWALANEEGPAAKPGILRVKISEGGWLLEPDGQGATRTTYSVFTDGGGALPVFLANNGSRIGIRKVFEAIRKRVKDPKIAATAKAAASNTEPE